MSPYGFNYFSMQRWSQKSKDVRAGSCLVKAVPGYPGNSAVGSVYVSGNVQQVYGF